MPSTPASRTALTRERVLAAAVHVADAAGPAAVTMRRLAEALDVHPTSIYHHLPSKEAILDGLVDALVAEFDLAGPIPDWPTWVRRLAAALRRSAQAHPGAFLVLAQRPSEGEASRRHSAQALDLLLRGGFSLDVAAQAVSGISLALLGVALNECPPVGPFSGSYAALDTAPVWDLMVESLIAGLAQMAGRVT